VQKKQFANIKSKLVTRAASHVEREEEAPKEIFSNAAKKNYFNKRNENLENYEEKTKLEIVNTLLNINGSMKEFSTDLGNRLSKAHNSSAGRQYGISDV